jgi:hypothetical protein
VRNVLSTTRGSDGINKSKDDARCQSIGLALWLVLLTIPLLVAAAYAVSFAQTALLDTTTVQVGDLGTLPLDGAPAALAYDRKAGKLSYRGVIDDAAKRKLTDVVNNASAAQEASRKVYLTAVDRIAQESGGNGTTVVLYLLLLGGLSGTLGVQLRSLTNYVGHACFKRDLNVSIWWPYYVVRPVTGFLLGVALVAVVQSGLLSPSSTSTDRVLWWAALALLAGFGEEEFTQRLRLVSKTVFGDKGSISSDGSNSDQTPQENPTARLGHSGGSKTTSGIPSATDTA